MKGKKMLLKKMVSSLVAASMVFGLAACGAKQGGNQKQDSSLAKQYVYAMEEFELPEMGDEWNVDSVSRDGDMLNIIAHVYHWNSVGSENDVRLISVDINSGTVEQIFLEGLGNEASDTVEAEDEMEEDDLTDTYVEEDAGSSVYDYTGFNDFTIVDDVIYAIKQTNHDDYTDPENYTSEVQNSLCAWNTQGELLWEREMEDLKESEDSYSYIMKMLSLGDGEITFLVSGDSLFKVTMDAEGNFSGKQSLPNGSEILNNFNGLFEGQNGELLVTYFDDSWSNLYMAEYDVKQDKLGEAVAIPQDIAWNSYGGMYSGVSHDLIYCTSGGLFGYDIGSRTLFRS